MLVPARVHALLLLLLVLSPTFPCVAQLAQRIRPLPYNLKTEAKMKGTIEELQLPLKGREKEAARLRLNNGTEIVDVYLCPESFLQDLGFSFSKGDEIALTGSKVKEGEVDLILAREVVKGNDTLVLRDEKGNPVWSGRR
jgi:hypothetical protein